MDKEFTATFIGHSDCYGVNPNDVRSAVITLAEKGAQNFLNGGMGGFDWLCAKTVFELKKDYPQIKNCLVIPYLTFKIFNKDYFDEIIYPEGFEKYYFRAAIEARNKYLVDNSAYAICYVNHDWGGAAKTYKRAKKKELEIINLDGYYLK